MVSFDQWTSFPDQIFYHNATMEIIQPPVESRIVTKILCWRSEGSIQQSMANNQKRMEISILSDCTMPGNIQSIWQACFLDFKRIKWKEQCHSWNEMKTECHIAFQLKFNKPKDISYSLPFTISIHWIYSICSLTWVLSFYKCAMFMHHAKTNFQSLRTWPGRCK